MPTRPSSRRSATRQRRARGPTTTEEADCYSCRESARPDPPAWQSIYRDEHWRLCHSFNSSLPGWLVAVPLRHVTSLDELTPDEASGLGLLLQRASGALRDVTGCVKTYVILLAEAEGYAHVHFHIVPRMREFTDEQRGPNVFTFLGDDESKWVSSEEMDRIALAIRAELDKH